MQAGHGTGAKGAGYIGVTCISLICISQVVVCQLRNSTITLFWDERAVLSGSAGGNAAASVPFTGSDQ
ncbi:Uncharacterised protein [Mycobacterium tuberculosis]|nr:Uncharacterised protein [Mycobacterium tuberculosis]